MHYNLSSAQSAQEFQADDKNLSSLFWCMLRHFEFPDIATFDEWMLAIHISDIQMSWRHQMPKHESQNTFYWITWEVNTVW